ncbi:MAG: hypothetical protein AB8B92_05165, partial [Gammaproteobacteria bacterium]
MNFVYIIIGAVVGVAVGQNGLGAVSGAGIGYLLGELLRLKTREKYTVEQVKELIRKVNALQATSNNNAQDEVSTAYQQSDNAAAQDDIENDVGSELGPGPKRKAPKDKFAQAITDAALAREQSKFTIEEPLAVNNIEGASSSESNAGDYKQTIKPVEYKENALLEGISNTFNAVIGFF